MAIVQETLIIRHGNGIPEGKNISFLFIFLLKTGEICFGRLSYLQFMSWREAQIKRGRETFKIYCHEKNWNESLALKTKSLV